MNFVNPALALAGLACVAIPIIIHLLMRRRRRPVQWAAMRFLMEAYRQQRRRLRLEQLLLLAARCLVIALVALALGRPFFGEAAAFGGRQAMTLYLLVDNGLASSAANGDRSALDRHKSAASMLLGQLDPAAGDRAGLIVLGGPAQALVAPPTSDTGALRELVRNLAPTHSPTDLPGGLSFVASELGGESGGTRTVVAVLSDFLTGSADTERILTQLMRSAEPGRPAAGRRDDVMLLVSRPAEVGADNISITGVEPLRPVIIARPNGDQRVASGATVRITLRRSGTHMGEAAATTVRLAIEDERGGSTPAGQAAVRWSPGQTEATASVPLDTSRIEAPSMAGTASVILAASIDPDAIPGDNTWRRPMEVRRALRIGIVAPRRLGVPGGGAEGLHQFEPSDWVRVALAPTSDGLGGRATDSEIEVLEIEPTALDATRLAGLDAAIITRPDLITEPAWVRLRTFADAGGMIMVMPPHRGQVHLWPDAMVRELGLNWSVAREARQYEQPAALAIDRAGLERGEGSSGLLALLYAELPDLAPPVGVTRLLPVEVPMADGETEVGHSAGRTGALLRLQDGAPLVLASPPGVLDENDNGRPARGLVVLITTAFNFDWTDLHARPLMVPLMHELVRQGVGQAIGSRVQLAGRFAPLPARATELHSLSGEGAASRQVIRADAPGGRTQEPLRQAGLWKAVDDRGVMRAMIAINADPAGGRADAQPAQTIHDWLASTLPGGEWAAVQWLDAVEPAGDRPQAGAGSLHAIFDRRADDALFAFPLLLAALLLACTELVMARWFSYGARPAGAAAAPATLSART